MFGCCRVVHSLSRDDWALQKEHFLDQITQSKLQLATFSAAVRECDRQLRKFPSEPKDGS